MKASVKGAKAGENGAKAHAKGARAGIYIIDCKETGAKGGLRLDCHLIFHIPLHICTPQGYR